jgi:hypothetical protein
VNLVRQKQDLFVKLGELFGPLRKVGRNLSTASEQDKSRAVAQFAAEYFAVLLTFQHFSKAQPGLDFLVESRRFSEALQNVIHNVQVGRPIDVVAEEQFSMALAALDAISVPATSMILEPESPFNAYSQLRALCELEATRSLTWLDPYIDASVFSRYLSALRPGVHVTLVSVEVPASTSAGRNRNRDRWVQFLEISRLYAKEYGAGSYRLVVNPQLHDRWAVTDGNRIYQLGGSAKDAADTKYFTIGTVEASPNNLGKLAQLCGGGAECFGPSTSLHA